MRASLLLLMVAVSALISGCDPGDQPGALAATLASSGAGKVVRLPDGRDFFLRCMGKGSPTVVLESGFGAGADAWFKVQPTLARTTRVCASDRAGFGRSDPGPLPRDAANIGRDLDAALRATGEKGPFVLVGHSAGGLYVRVFAARHPGRVVGLVLVDPTVEHMAPPGPNDGLGGIRARLQRCLRAAESPAAAEADGRGCRSTQPDKASEVWSNRLAELDDLFGRSSEQVMRANGLLGPIPIYVLTASQTAAAAPEYAGQSVLQFDHSRIAGYSREGSQRTVVSSHLMMIDRPDAVLQAITQLVEAARAGRPAPPLPASEGAVPDSVGDLDHLLSVPLDLGGHKRDEVLSE